MISVLKRRRIKIMFTFCGDDLLLLIPNLKIHMNGQASPSMLVPPSQEQIAVQNLQGGQAVEELPENGQALETAPQRTEPES